MWFSPRRTIRAVVDAETRPSWLPVAALTALNSVITALQFDPLTENVSVSRSLFPVAMQLVQFGFGIFIGPFLLAIVGGWFGGEGDPRDIRQAVVWGYLPYAVVMVPWTVMLLVGGMHMFDPTTASGATTAVVVLLFGIVFLVATGWSAVLVIAGIAEVQRLSIWRAVASYCILLIPVVLLGLLSRVR